MPGRRHLRTSQLPARSGRIAAAFALLLLASAAGCGGRGKPAVANFDWLSGCWSGKVEGSVVDEQWSKPAGGSMLGTSRQIKDGKTVGREYRDIDEGEGTVVLVLRAVGGTDAHFRLSDSGSSHVAFVRDDGDPPNANPRRILYHRRGNSLYVRFEVLDEGRKVEQKIKLKRDTCE
jgi:hypothetical protein